MYISLLFTKYLRTSDRNHDNAFYGNRCPYIFDHKEVGLVVYPVVTGKSKGASGKRNKNTGGARERKKQMNGNKGRNSLQT